MSGEGILPNDPYRSPCRLPFDAGFTHFSGVDKLASGACDAPEAHFPDGSGIILPTISWGGGPCEAWWRGDPGNPNVND